MEFVKNVGTEGWLDDFAEILSYFKISTEKFENLLKLKYKKLGKAIIEALEVLKSKSV